MFKSELILHSETEVAQEIINKKLPKINTGLA